MRILVSACLLGTNCKYNGGNNKNEELLRLLEGHEVVPVCPEVEGGLSTPRVPSEIVNGVVTNRDGESVDREFRRGAAICLERALKEKIDFAILQSRSPSCGVGTIYDGSFSGAKISGNGVFAAELINAGIDVRDVADLNKEWFAKK